MRRIADIGDYFNIIDGIGNGMIVSLGYVTGADLKLPQIKRKNPATNRMKGYDDFSQWQEEGGPEIGAIIKITAYQFNYHKRSAIKSKYRNEYLPAVNQIRAKYGLEPSKPKSKAEKATQTMGYGGGIEVYDGENEDKMGNNYCPQNLWKPIRKTERYYAVDTDGNIIKELSTESIMPYVKAKAPHSGVSELRKMGADEAKIEAYIEELDNLKFKYKKLEAHSILWIAAKANGERIVYINQGLERSVEGVNINKQDFINIANKRYSKEMSELDNLQETYYNSKNRLTENRGDKVRLTESDLHRVIKECVKRILKQNLR